MKALTPGILGLLLLAACAPATTQLRRPALPRPEALSWIKALGPAGPGRVALAESNSDLALARQAPGSAGEHPALSLNFIPEDKGRFPWSQLVISRAWGAGLDLHFTSDGRLLLAASFQGKARLGGRELESPARWSLLLADLDPQDGRLRWASLSPQDRSCARIQLSSDARSRLWLAADSTLSSLDAGGRTIWSKDLAGSILEMESLPGRGVVVALRKGAERDEIMAFDLDGEPIWRHRARNLDRILGLQRKRSGDLVVLGRVSSPGHACALLELTGAGETLRERVLEEEAGFECQKMSLGNDDRLYLAGTRHENTLAFLRLPDLSSPVDWRIALGRLWQSPTQRTSFQEIRATSQRDLCALVELRGRLPTTSMEIIEAQDPSLVWLLLRPSSFSIAPGAP